jgi:hypothetical protein
MSLKYSCRKKSVTLFWVNVLHRNSWEYSSPERDKCVTTLVFVAYFPKAGLCDPQSICKHVYPSPYQLLNPWTDMKLGLYNHGNWARLNGVFHKYLPSVCVSMYIASFFVRQVLGKHVPVATNTLINRRILGPRHFLCGLCLMKAESVGLSVCPSLVATYQLDKDVLAVTMNCWCRFLCSPCRIKGK